MIQRCTGVRSLPWARTPGRSGAEISSREALELRGLPPLAAEEPGELLPERRMPDVEPPEERPVLPHQVLGTQVAERYPGPPVDDGLLAEPQLQVRPEPGERGEAPQQQEAADDGEQRRAGCERPPRLVLQPGEGQDGAGEQQHHAARADPEEPAGGEDEGPSIRRTASSPSNSNDPRRASLDGPLKRVELTGHPHGQDATSSLTGRSSARMAAWGGSSRHVPVRPTGGAA